MRFLFLIVISLMLSSCNKAMVGGFADAYNRSSRTPSENLAYETRKLRREMEDMQRAQARMKRQAFTKCLINSDISGANMVYC